MDSSRRLAAHEVLSVQLFIILIYSYLGSMSGPCRRLDTKHSQVKCIHFSSQIKYFIEICLCNFELRFDEQ